MPLTLVDNEDMARMAMLPGRGTGVPPVAQIQVFAWHMTSLMLTETPAPCALQVRFDQVAVRLMKFIPGVQA